MSLETVIIQGTLQTDGSLVLDQKPNLRPGRVQVILQVVEESRPNDPIWWQRLQEIWQAQKARGDKGRSREEIDADLATQRAEDEAYEERWRHIWAQTEPSVPPEEKPQ